MSVWRILILYSLFVLPSYSYAVDSAPGDAGSSASIQLSRHEVRSGDDHNADVAKSQSSSDIVGLKAEKEKGVASYPSNPKATKAVDRNISLFTERIKERFSVWLQRSGRYLEMMKEILKGKNIPEDIAFLPLIESGFNPSAYSVARAVGPWQFIAGTGRKYGLKIDWWRDERKDPIKSTEAAASYLSDLYGMFGSWNLAMAAYNAGEGKILRALNKSKEDDYWALLDTRYIKKETKEYVPRFIAATLIASNPVEYGFEGLDYHSAMRFDTVVLDRPIDLEVAAVCSEASLNAIKELNPELRRWSTPPNVSSYTLRIPYGKKETFLENLSRVPEEERFSISTYTIKKGDTIKKISYKMGIPADVIADLNNGAAEAKQMRAGEKIYMPMKNKLSQDMDDRVEKKKSAAKNKKVKSANNKKRKSGKMLVTSLNAKHPYIND